ncbi:MAG: chromosome partitioning protein ParB [bacterium]
MARDVELSSFDLRYEDHRMKNSRLEAKLLVSIQERGVERPLEGVDIDARRILLNGFKRYRCARRLGLGIVPYASLGSDEAMGIIAVLRASGEKKLSIIEQAQFVEDLSQQHRLTVLEIAECLSRSKSWVVMRLGLVREMEGVVREKVLCGAFPVYSYMYTLRPLLRSNSKAKVAAFVAATAGKKLSIREIQQLADGYFSGPQWFQEEIDSGHLALALERIEQAPAAPEGSSKFEQVLLSDLETLSKSLRRVLRKSQNPQLKTRSFRAQASLLLAGILSRMDAFQKALRELHDRTRQA